MKALLPIQFLLLIFLFRGGAINIVEKNIPSKSENSLLSKNIIACSPKQQKIQYSNARVDSLEEISGNDNRKIAGRLVNNIFHINLEARTGGWYPETHEGAGLEVHAFAEEGKPLQIPGPQIRIPEGTVIEGQIKNLIKDHPLVLYGLFSRPGTDGDSVVIKPGDSYKFSFIAGKAGTYFYRAYAGDSLWDNLPFFNDSQLYGAFIIDPPGKRVDVEERVMIIGLWNDTANGPTNFGEELVINGMTWPYTERLSYKQNQMVHWRVINASNQAHPMHLHGFYFTRTSKGNLVKDSIYSTSAYRPQVTELLSPGETISLKWKPEKEGNWLFHCHTLVHIMPYSFLREITTMVEEAMTNIEHHARDGMGGLIMGITVLPDGKSRPVKDIKYRQLTLAIGEQDNYFDTLDGKGFKLYENDQAIINNYSIPGPPIVLTRDQPVAIKVINHLKEATTIHWHGLEIESYFDGVSGWGNKGALLAPIIQAGDSFIVYIKPPRAGTFIYHTHMHNLQLLEGMSGPLIVVEPGEKYNPEKDKIFFITQADEDFERFLFLLNGTNKTDTMKLKRNVVYRFRQINITALGPDISTSLLFNDMPYKWKFISKDGADLPIKDQHTQLAFNERLSIGETKDFEFKSNVAGNYLFEVRNASSGKVCSKIIQVL